jgi:hypothetical protein
LTDPRRPDGYPGVTRAVRSWMLVRRLQEATDEAGGTRCYDRLDWSALLCWAR